MKDETGVSKRNPVATDLCCAKLAVISAAKEANDKIRLAFITNDGSGAGGGG